jgi:hypothetical protein
MKNCWNPSVTFAECNRGFAAKSLNPVAVYGGLRLLFSLSILYLFYRPSVQLTACGWCHPSIHHNSACMRRHTDSSLEAKQLMTQTTIIASSSSGACSPLLRRQVANLSRSGMHDHPPVFVWFWCRFSLKKLGLYLYFFSSCNKLVVRILASFQENKNYVYACGCDTVYIYWCGNQPFVYSIIW